ncbi:neuromedin-U receptor 2-like isoform X1 [Actinia tenebrosa]|uniref:Neuromedin-U receptor 2-like isoform X1 n=1 Tax=Actinia tenebrosa TaxID=6105 RepID=A0A6P8JAJ0_ACTTE|nr:neuromedin-U receptor 2-like isoform X1 [Actinia tenebrosa]XP_031574743.1 neuromedin-U receptor 2-like isoform X1 [Actinia tenebrosa]
MILNIIVITTTSRSRVLRQSVAHVLVANISVGDLLISFYMIIIISTRQSMTAENYFSMYLPYYCRIVGLFFLIGQFSSPGMSFIMTIERYLAVVYCMRPHIRITRRMSFVIIAIIWSISVSLAVSFMTSPQFSTQTDSMCVTSRNMRSQQVLYYIGGIGVLLYVISIALYGHMYVDFQKTNQKTVQLQRENRLARRIALIMFTNVLFFILPLAVIAAVNGFQDHISNATLHIFWNTFGITFLGINPYIASILFYFRSGMSNFEVNFGNCIDFVVELLIFSLDSSYCLLGVLRYSLCLDIFYVHSIAKSLSDSKT